MTRSFCSFASCLLLLPTLSIAQALSSIEKDWAAEHYPDPQNEIVRKELLGYWNSPSGRTWQVAYMIGTTECRMAGMQPDGRTMLDHALAFGRLTTKDKDVIENELNACQSVTASAPMLVPISASTNPGQATAGVVGAGKGGFMIYVDKQQANSVLMTSSLSEEQLLDRRVRIGQGDSNTAFNNALKLLRPSYSPDTEFGHAKVDQFMIVIEDPDNEIAKKTGECLVPYKFSLAHDFDMALPPDLVMVYALPSIESVSDYGKILHGLQISPGIVAYSIYDDLSIVGVGGEDACGTLAHELTHLMIRNNFGDAPPWLEEGLASEIAVGIPSTAKFQFEKSWRDDMLQREWSLRPSLSDLINASWDIFQAKSNDDLDRSAAANAMAASFVRYLDERGVLGTVYTQIRDAEFNSNLKQQHTPEAILEHAMTKSISGIEQDFTSWFHNQYQDQNPKPTRKPGGGSQY